MAGYSLELAVWGGAAASLLYLLKLAWPLPAQDRLAGISLITAFFATCIGLAAAAGQGQPIPAWCVFCVPLLILYWILETEFATRLLGLVPALLTTLAPLLLGAERWVGHLHQGWTTMAELGLLAGMAMLALALGTWSLMLPLRSVPAVQVRKTARLFVVNPPVLAELSYRCNTWALPFLVGAAAAALLGVRPGQVPGEVFLWLLGTLVGSVAYTTLARRDGFSWAVVLLAGAMLTACFGWRGLPADAAAAPRKPVAHVLEFGR
ncbi:MAG: hypothetical protein VKP57_01185 [Candidatus Sericytochromatia bacterium]|nr:hypothetical protein [Candidatus Sericytochromatia bacterium]